MTYTQAVEYINSFLIFGSKPGLDRISNLLKLLGNPEKKLKFIHVAGTNGKGSVCAYLSSVLIADGKKTGLFTSPYVTDFAERFQIDGKNISHSELAKITEKVKAVVETIDDDLYPTEFELITAIAYIWFAEQNCDIVVLEVGLGGLYDSTNTIDTPLCSVITSISLDHVAVLGDTVEKIAAQKAGIIKPNGKTVLYPVWQAEVFNVISSTATDKNNDLIIPNKDKLKIMNECIGGTTAEYGDIHFTTHILGNIQPLNVITAIEAVKASVPEIDNETIEKGIEKATISARCQVVDEMRPVIVDGAHNPDGVLALENVIKRFVDRPMVAVLGMMKDKDIDNVLCTLGGCFAHIYTVTVNNPRSITADELAKKAEKYCPATACESIEQAIKKAYANLDCGVCICGSFYLISEAVEFLPFDL